MKYEVQIDYCLQLADVIKEAKLCYPLAKDIHQSCFLYWHYQSVRMNGQRDRAIHYEANLKFRLLSLLMLTKEQFS